MYKCKIVQKNPINPTITDAHHLGILFQLTHLEINKPSQPPVLRIKQVISLSNFQNKSP